MRKSLVMTLAALLTFAALTTALAQDATPNPRDAIAQTATAFDEQDGASPTIRPSSTTTGVGPRMTATRFPEWTATAESLATSNAASEGDAVPGESAIFATSTALADFFTELTATAIERGPTQTPTPTATVTPTMPPRDITSGGTIRDELRADGRVRYTFDYEGSGFIQINMMSDAFDTYLQIYDDNGNLLVSDDDGGDGTNSLISGFQPPAPGTYTVIASSFNVIVSSGIDRGSFTLTFANYTPEQIGYGDRIEAVLAGPSVVYTFAGRAGDVVTIRLESSDFDPMLALLRDGEELAYNDDYASGSFNAQIDSFTLPEDGLYTIEGAAFGSTGGAFTLILAEGGGGFASGGVIGYGASVSGTLRGPEARYSFTGQAGDVITASLESEAFDAVLTLRQDGREIASDDDSGEALNALLDGITLEADGTYTLIVSGFSSQGGPFTLTLERLALTSLELGELTLLRFDDNEQPQLLTFEGEAGTRVSITVLGADADVTLTDPGGTLFAIVASWEPAPQIRNFNLPRTGTYTLSLAPYDTEGAVSVLVESIPMRDLSAEQTVSVTPAGVLLAFDAEAGETLTFTLTPSGDSLAPVTASVVVNGENLGEFFGEGGTRLAFAITADETGVGELYLSGTATESLFTLAFSRGE